MSGSTARDISGLKFGRWTAIRQVGHRKFPAGGAHAVWEAVCECGTVRHVAGGSLVSGHSKSCGCLKAEQPGNLKHGHARGARSATYKLWCSLRLRRAGIHPRWQNYENFLADMGERPEGKELDRIDNAKGYEPGNCRWVTRVESIANRTNTIMVEFEGRDVPLSWLAREYGLRYHTVRLRYVKGKRGMELVEPLQSSAGGRLILKD